MVSFVSIKNALSAGELSPSLYGRTDVEKWLSGTSTCRNFFVNYRGGIISRGGLAYVGTCKQPGTEAPPRDIPFQFSINQGYVLEFGDEYLRIKVNGAYVTGDSVVVSSISSSAVFTTGTNHGYSVGDWVYIHSDVPDELGQFNNLTWIVATTPALNTFTVTDLFGTAISSYSGTGTGTSQIIVTIDSPYAAEDLIYLKYTQSADVMTLTCVNTDTETEYPPYSLIRHSNTSWEFVETTFAATIQPPTNLTARASSSGPATTWYSYVVTSISGDTGEESVSSSPVNIQNNNISISSGTNTIFWDAVEGASGYNIYAATPSYSIDVPVSSLYGFVGTSLAPGFTDTNIIPDFTVVPPVHKNPFARGAILDILPTAGGSNYSQSTIGYSITTSTGTGFAGTPVVSGGKLKGFVIRNQGEGYADSDTISFTDSGGGLATGTFTLASNPPGSGDPIAVFNGISVAFKPAPASGIVSGVIISEIENNKELTIQTLANTLNSATNVLSLAVATYSASGNVLTVTYKTPGTIGNGYTLGAGTSGGSVSGATLTGGGTAGSGATATLTVSPQSGTYPSVPAYFQERRVYAGSLNNPDTYWMSQPGLFDNMDSSIPIVDSDAITGTPWAQQVNGIQFLVPMPGGLVVLTGKGAWQVNGGASAAITPSNQNAVPQAYNGCHNHVPPVTINYDILYVQAKGSIVRDLSYNFFVNIYTGVDLTVLSSHLFTNRQIVQWAYAEEPYKLVWIVMDDGTLLCLTYLKEQEVYAWSRHDTNGQVLGVCSINEPINPNLNTPNPPLTDGVYFIVKRYVQGAWRYYSERMDNRIWEDVEDSFCVDSGLSTSATYPSATLTASASTGTDVTFTASSSVFTSDNEGDVIRMGNGIATITDYVNGTTVTCDITQDITAVIPNDPNDTPAPAPSGTWNISTPVTTITGLNHLNGLTVSILADGSVVANQVVTNNSITLPYPASKVVAGLPYTCQAQTLYIDHPQGENTAQNRRKDINSVGLRVCNTRGLELGADQPDQAAQPDNQNVPWTNMVEIKERNNSVYAGSAIPLYTGDYFQNISSGWSMKGQVAIQQNYPLPAEILSVITYWNLGDSDT